MPATKLILFAGAPPQSAVTESSCTVTEFLPPFTNFLELPEPVSKETPSSLRTLAAWRSVPLRRKALHTGFTQWHSFLSADGPRHADFFSTADVSLDETQESLNDADATQEALTQFFEASLSALGSTSILSDLDSFDASFMTSSSQGDTSRASQNLPHQANPVAAHLSDLEDIPPASRIVELNPSTVTLNLVVGILSVAQPRTITTRWGKTMSLVEILVGDDTRSGFAVTFWIPEADLVNSPVAQLRRQEVVLLQNVALHVFRGKVYGQSLRKNMTKVNVLWSPRRRGLYSTRDLARSNPPHPQMEKARLVKDWVLRFVGADPGTSRRSKRRLRSWDEPPPDSQ